MKNQNFKKLVDTLKTYGGKTLDKKEDFIDDLLESEDITHLKIAIKRKSSTKLLENDEKNYNILMNFIKSIDGIDALIYIEKCQKEITQKQLHKKSSNLPKIERFKEARIQLIKELVNWLYVEE